MNIRETMNVDEIDRGGMQQGIKAKGLKAKKKA